MVVSIYIPINNAREHKVMNLASFMLESNGMFIVEQLSPFYVATTLLACSFFRSPTD